MNKNWMIYGAYGYTGRLIAKEAVKKGYKPVLAGRSSERLIPLAEKLNLDCIVFDLANEETIIENIQDFDLVFLAAGPYKYTSAPMVKACIKTSSNYLDITGEVPIFEQNFKYDQQAKENGILVLSGVGFDVVPSDCMAKYVSEKIQNPTNLEIGVAGLSSSSPGTLKTMIEYMDTSSLIRKNGKLVQENPEKSLRKIRFFDQVRKVRPIVWGDLSTAYRSTGIQNIITYMPLSKQITNLMNATIFSKNNNNSETSKKEDFKTMARKWIDENVKGPDKITRQKARSYVWVRVRNDEGLEAQAWLDTIEPYKFTMVSGIKCVEKVFNLDLKGALTPSMAFGKDFILEFPETKRYDHLDD